MPLGLLGKKIGMSQVFNEDGELIPVTVIHAGPCPILLKREMDRDGYAALQLGFDPKPNRVVNKPEAGSTKKVWESMDSAVKDRILAPTAKKGNGEAVDGGIDAVREKYSNGSMRFVREIRIEDVASAADLKVGQILDVTVFKPGDRIDVTGTSRGRGFAGPYKRCRSKPGPEGHGSMYHRRPGSMGGSSDPSRTFKMKPSAGHMGHARVTLQNLQVVRVDAERNLLLVRGAVPGAPQGYVVIRPTVKLRRRPAKTHLR